MTSPSTPILVSAERGPRDFALPSTWQGALESLVGLGLAWTVTRAWPQPAMPWDLLAAATAIVAARYGFAVGAACGLGAGLVRLLEAGVGPAELLAVGADRGAVAAAFGYLALGAAVGLIGDMPRRSAARAAEERDRHATNFTELSTRYDALVAAKEAIDRRIVGQVQTIGSLYEAAKELETLDPASVVPATLRLLRRYLEVEAASYYKLEGDSLCLAETLGDRAGRPERLAALTGPLAEVVRGEPLAVRTLAEHAAAPFLLAVAVKAPDGRVRGVLAIERLPFHQLTPSTLQLLSLLGDWASRALASAETYAEANSARRDHPLTRLHREPYMAERFRAEWATAQRYKLPLSVIMLRKSGLSGLDEAAWAEAACEVADALRAQTRTMDVVGHYRTADSFWMVLPVTPPEGALILANRLIQALPGVHAAVAGNAQAEDAEGLLLLLQAELFEASSV